MKTMSSTDANNFLKSFATKSQEFWANIEFAIENGSSTASILDLVNTHDANVLDAALEPFTKKRKRNDE
jgi:hypothetical protein